MLYYQNSMFTYRIYIYIYIYNMTFDFFYISGSLVVPSVDHLNMNRTIKYEHKPFFEMELISSH
jgi:hypothetical protein